ncbi:MAG TPA: lysophospholipid acyltransferase family protein [Rhizomicrobium sp.]
MSDARPSLWQRLRYALEAAGFFAVIGMSRAFQVDTASSLGGWLGRTILYRTPVSARARANLDLAYPGIGDTARESIIREMWDNLGRTIAEYGHLARFTVKGPDARIEVSGFEHVERAAADGRGTIFVSGHFANWEMLPFAAAQSGVEGGAVYRPLNNPLVDRWMVRQRRANGPDEMIAKGPQGTRRIFTLLRNRKAIFMLVDQKTNQGLAIPFFSHDAMTTPAPAALALKLGAILLPTSNERLGGARFRVTVHPPIVFEPGGDHDRDVVALTTAMNAAIETCVRRRPSQWLWIHRRWPKPGDTPRSRRGKDAQALGGAEPQAKPDRSGPI